MPRNVPASTGPDSGALFIGGGADKACASEWGAIDVSVELDDRIRRRVVSLEHGWGLQRGLRRSVTGPGVNVNALMPVGAGSFEALSNQQFLTGVPVDVRVVATSAP